MYTLLLAVYFQVEELTPVYETLGPAYGRLQQSLRAQQMRHPRQRGRSDSAGTVLFQKCTPCDPKVSALCTAGEHHDADNVTFACAGKI